MSSEEEYSECATPDIMNYDQKKLVNDKYGSISLCKLFNSKNYFRNNYFLIMVFFDFEEKILILKETHTVESPNSHTPNSHTYSNSYTLFGLTKM